MFELKNVECLCSSYNARGEMHGDKPVPAFDLKLKFTAPNTLLTAFGEHLRDAFYWNNPTAAEAARKAAEASRAQGEIEVPTPKPTSDLPHLKLPQLAGPFALDFEQDGYCLIVDWGIGGKSNIEVKDVKVSDVSFNPLEGGSCSFEVRVSRSDADEKSRGKLSGLIKHKLHIHLFPMSEDIEKAAA